MTLCIGLTGGIGCGKSTVANLFAQHGAGIIDTDFIAHSLTRANGEAIEAIRASFGNDYVTTYNALDREKMRQLVFSDAAAKRRLEGILHPLILEQCKMELQQARQAPYVIAVVPLLLESPEFLKLVRRVLVVDCDEETQIARVTGRSQLSRAEVLAIIAQQTPRAIRLARADDLITNDADIDALKKQVEALHKRYSGLDKQNSN